MSEETRILPVRTLSHLVELMPGAVLAVGADGLVAAANTAAGELFRTGSLVGRALEQLTWQDTADATWRGRRDDGSELAVDVTTGSLATDDGDVTIVCIRDASERTASERELERAREHLLRAQQVADVGSWRWVVESGVVTWSAQMHLIHGTVERPQTQEEVARYLHDDDRARMTAAVTSCVLRGAPFDEEYRIVRSDGSIRWLHGRGAATRDASGRVVEVVGTAHDVTERREAGEALRRSEERYRLLAENVSDVIYLMSGTGGFDYISPSVLAMTGYSADDYMDDPAFAMNTVHPDDRPGLQERLVSGNWDEPYTCRVLRRDGSVIWTEQRSRLIRDADGTVVGLMGVARDVTDRVAAEEELRRANETKDLFLEAVAHELRGPVTVILGLARLVESGAAPERDQSFTSRIVANARRLERLLGDLLDLDQLRRGAVISELKETNLRQLAHGSVEAAEARDHPVRVEAPDSSVEIDASKVERILVNLIGNAIAHTPPGTSVSVVMSRRHDGLEIAVSDDGPGVPDEFKDDIFAPFNRGPRFGPGTGLGLSIVRGFAELLGGRVWVEDHSGGGARFVVALPLPAPAR